MAGNLSFTDGEYLFREGESGEYAYIVNSGKIEITKISANGEDVLVTLEPPSLFGDWLSIARCARVQFTYKGDTIITLRSGQHLLSTNTSRKIPKPLSG